jgi:DNA repair exonuclease SbcCD ATPase subunit
MIIRRIQVEEGFLDGLDLSFDSGLNVLIGPRGAGKTSIIELIRFALGASALTDNVAQSAKAHALSILGSGNVTVTLNDGGEDFTLKRTAESWTTNGPKGFTRPVILSQNEIESVGLQASGRLRLIDSIRSVGEPPDADKESTLLSFIRSQTEERRVITNELQGVRQQLRELAEQLKEADVLKKQHAEALSGIEKAQAQNQRLAQLSGWLASLSVRNALYSRLQASLQQRLLRLQSFSTGTTVEAWPTAAGSDDPLGKVRQAVAESQTALETAIRRIEDAIAEVQSLATFNNAQSLEYEEESRGLRRQLEALQHGAGEAARRLAVIQEKASQQSALKDLEKSNLVQLRQLQTTRKKHLDELEEVRVLRFNERAKVIEELNKEFSPRIRISIERAGQNSEYASAIVAALRGSGLRFNEVAPLIADQMSPREFVEAIESENVDELARITGLATARASRIIDRIKEEGVEGILTATVEDGVTLSLLDGTEYKTTEQLSTGQRCTVVLPLLMKQERLPVVVDQPEDHLDNAFIVDTLIKAITKRKRQGQLIFSTHNANIPVLGGADQVTLLGSDGSRGFVRHSAALETPETVEGITTIMEGGMEAFERRAKFYHRDTAELF